MHLKGRLHGAKHEPALLLLLRRHAWRGLARDASRDLRRVVIVLAQLEVLQNLAHLFRGDGGNAKAPSVQLRHHALHHGQRHFRALLGLKGIEPVLEVVVPLVAERCKLPHFLPVCNLLRRCLHVQPGAAALGAGQQGFRGQHNHVDIAPVTCVPVFHQHWRLLSHEVRDKLVPQRAAVVPAGSRRPSCALAVPDCSRSFFHHLPSLSLPQPAARVPASAAAPPQPLILFHVWRYGPLKLSFCLPRLHSRVTRGHVVGFLLQPQLFMNAPPRRVRDG